MIAVEIDVILAAIAELKELTENQDKCQFDEISHENLNDIRGDVAELCVMLDDCSEHLATIETSITNIEHVAQYGFSLALVVLGAVILIKTFFTGW